MSKLLITLEISNNEVVSEYAGVADELILEDLKSGDLIEYCDIFRVEVVE